MKESTKAYHQKIIGDRPDLKRLFKNPNLLNTAVVREIDGHTLLFVPDNKRKIILISEMVGVSFAVGHGLWPWLVNFVNPYSWSVYREIQRIGYQKAAYITHILEFLPEEEEEGFVLCKERMIIHARGDENLVTLAKRIED